MIDRFVRCFRFFLAVLIAVVVTLLCLPVYFALLLAESASVLPAVLRLVDSFCECLPLPSDSEDV